MNMNVDDLSEIGFLKWLKNILDFCRNFIYKTHMEICVCSSFSSQTRHALLH